MKLEKTITVTLEMEEVMNEACELVDLLKKPTHYQMSWLKS